MTGRFAVGVVVGGLAALTPFLTPAVIVVGMWSLYVQGVHVDGKSATDGVFWVSGWTAILTGVLVALTLLLLGLWGAPRATLTAVGTLLALAAVRKHMIENRGGPDGLV